MGGGVGVGGGGADEKRGGASGTVRERSVVPLGPLATGAGAGLDGASRWPHVTQKRSPRWFELPQRGQGLMGSGAECSGSPRGAKLTSGAGGRMRPVGTGGAGMRGTGAGCAMGGGGRRGRSQGGGRERGRHVHAPVRRKPDRRRRRCDARSEPLPTFLAERQMARVVPAARRANHAIAMGQRRAAESQGEPEAPALFTADPAPRPRRPARRSERCPSPSSLPETIHELEVHGAVGERRRGRTGPPRATSMPPPSVAVGPHVSTLHSLP